MPRRLAVAVAFVVFAVSVISGMAADNSFAEIIRRALIGMLVTLVIGLIVGAMGQKMLEENVKETMKKLEVSETEQPAKDR